MTIEFEENEGNNVDKMDIFKTKSDIDSDVDIETFMPLNLLELHGIKGDYTIDELDTDVDFENDGEFVKRDKYIAVNMLRDFKFTIEKEFASL